MRQAQKHIIVLLGLLCFFQNKILAQCDCTLTQDNLTTSIEPIQGNETAVSFYQFNTPNAGSSNTGLEQADHATSFLYEDTNTGIISLIIIFDSARQGDLDGGRASIGFNCFADDAVIELSDDTGEVTSLSGTWVWGPCCTDGAVISGMDCNSTFDLLVDIQAGITDFQWLSGSNNIALNPTTIDLPSLSSPVTISCNTGTDKDKDGIADQSDLDDDQDGILDTVEGNGDNDGDGIINSLDSDSDNDGIPDAIEACGFGTILSTNNGTCVLAGLKDCDGVIQTCTPPDTDADGTPDYLDTDSDNDGCTDAEESGIETVGSPQVNECGLINGTCFEPDNDDWLSDKNPTIICPTDLTFQCDDDIPEAYQNLTQFLNAGGITYDDCELEGFQFINETIE